MFLGVNTLQKTKVIIEHQPFEDVSPIESDFPLSCQFSETLDKSTIVSKLAVLRENPWQKRMPANPVNLGYCSFSKNPWIFFRRGKAQSLLGNDAVTRLEKPAKK